MIINWYLFIFEGILYILYTNKPFEMGNYNNIFT